MPTEKAWVERNLSYIILIVDSNGKIILTKEFDSRIEGYRFYNQKMIPGENGIPENAVSKKLVSKEVKTTLTTVIVRDVDEVAL